MEYLDRASSGVLDSTDISGHGNLDRRFSIMELKISSSPALLNPKYPARRKFILIIVNELTG